MHAQFAFFPFTVHVCVCIFLRNTGSNVELCHWSTYHVPNRYCKTRQLHPPEFISPFFGEEKYLLHKKCSFLWQVTRSVPHCNYYYPNLTMSCQYASTTRAELTSLRCQLGLLVSQISIHLPLFCKAKHQNTNNFSMHVDTDLQNCRGALLVTPACARAAL